MRKIAIAVLALIGLWIVCDVASRASLRAALRDEWPDGLGALESVPQRAHATKTNAAAERLIALTTPLGIDFRLRERKQHDLPTRARFDRVREPLANYLRTQLSRSGDAIDDPPTEVASYLATMTNDLGAVRDHFRATMPVWDMELKFDTPVPNLLGHMELSRALTAMALVRARAGDPAAWDDLHATWRMSESLFQRPDLISTLIGLAIARNANAAARKLPLPAPGWVESMRAFDYDRQLLVAQQTEAWVLSRYVTQLGAKRFFIAPYDRYSIADMLNYQREGAARIAASDVCASTPAPPQIASWNIIGKIATPNLDAAARRFRRFRAEREATANVLRIRSGQEPVTSTVCTDRTWQFAHRADGTIAMQMNKDIPVSESESLRVPLRY